MTAKTLYLTASATAKNLVTNPSFETDTTGWTPTNATITRVGPGKVGSYCGSLLASATNGLAQSATLYTTSGTESITISCWMKSSTALATMSLRNVTDATSLGSVTHSGSGLWERISLTVSVPTGKDLRINLFDARSSGWTPILVDGIQFERSAVLTDYSESSNHLNLQDGGSAPSTATTGTGWTAGTTASGNYAAMAAGVERLAATFATTVLPDALNGPNNTLGDCFRTNGILTGQFKQGIWTFTFPLIAVTAGGAADVRIRIRLWRSANASGANATEVLSLSSDDQVSQVQIGTAVTNLATGAAQSSVVTWTAPYFGLTAEYLFVQVALEITGAGGGATDDVLLRVGSAAVIATTDWRPASLTTHNVILDGLGLMFPEGSNGYGFSKAKEFAAKSGTGTTTNADRLRNQVKAWTDWTGGSGVALEDATKETRYRSGDGIDIFTTPGAALVGPGLTASLSSSRNAQRVFGTYNSQLYVGASTGQVARQTATDTWTDPVGTITSNRAVNGIVESTFTVNNVTSRMWVSNSINAQLASWNGTTFTNNAADANVGSNALTYISCLGSWPIGASESTASTKGNLIIGGKETASGQAVIAVAHASTTTWAAASTWASVNLQHASTGLTDITAMFASSDGGFWWAAGNPLSITGEIWKEPAVDNTVTATNEMFEAPHKLIATLTDDYITAIVETVNSSIYAIGYSNRLYKYDGTTMVVVAQGICPNGTQLAGLTVWNNALWISCRSGTGLLVRRFGPPDPANPSTDESSWIWSDPIYGGVIDASATAARALIPFGGYLYAATEASGASKIYRMDDGVYNTSAVTLESSVTDCGLTGLDKSFQSITVGHAALLSGESIQVLYRLNDTGSWISVGTSSTAGTTTATFTIDGRIGQSIAVQAILTAASSAATPALYDVTLTYRPFPSPSREWSNMRVDLRSITGSFMPLKDASFDTWTGLELRDAVWAILQRGVCQLIDIDEQVYSVAPDDWKGSLSQMPGFGGYRLEGSLSLSEV